ncbi:Sas10/Utp3/C1D family-domain-containing protein [Apiospora marii]|uniref:Exosome complex protein n=1 Tax=Apiospora marii TaxID=335849 RepID=A0ABR1RDV9_9PEZI
MDVTNILPQLERLDGDIDNLEEALQPILKGVSDLSSKLPLLEKAKLYVLATYALESMLFSSLRLNAVDAKNHPVFKELTRVRQYFDKIKNIETPPEKPEATLNKGAAISFIRSGLAENKDKDAAIKAAAQQKAQAQQAGTKRKVSDQESEASASDSEEEGEEDDDSEEAGEAAAVVAAPEPPKKKSKKEKKEKREGKAERKEKKEKSEKKDKKKKSKKDKKA